MRCYPPPRCRTQPSQSRLRANCSRPKSASMIALPAGTSCAFLTISPCQLTCSNHSGCITSAESVLITLQSHTEVLHFLGENPPAGSPAHKVPVLSIAPQSLASLAATLSSSSSGPVGLRQVLRRVEAFCMQVLGFEHVYDTTFARHISLLEHAREFWERKQDSKLPMLASACPGWICYAEKTHSEMLPFISRTKSPQQVMGTLVKSWLANTWGKQCVLTPIKSMVDLRLVSPTI